MFGRECIQVELKNNVAVVTSPGMPKAQRDEVWLTLKIPNFLAQTDIVCSFEENAERHNDRTLLFLCPTSVLVNIY